MADERDSEKVSAELIRALRGRRSQTALSRRLGYRSNVVYTWESARRWPTGAGLLHAASRVGNDVEQALIRFFRNRPQWMDAHDVCSPEGVAAFLRDLQGSMTITELAARTGRSRFAVGRWLKGTAEPRLPDFLALVEAASLRLLDFVALFVDPKSLPSLRRHWRQLEAARTLASDRPWAPAVLLCLQLEGYVALDGHQDGWIAQQIGIDPEMERDCLRLLHEAGQIRRRRGKWFVVRVQSVDTRRPGSGTNLKHWWGGVGLDRLEQGEEGLFSFNLFTVSEVDYQRIQDLQRAHYRAVRSIVAATEQSDRLVLANLHLVPLTPPL